MEKGGLSARQKGDIYWKKRKRYLAAAASRNGLKEGYINPDMAADVLQHYEELKAVDEPIVLSGNEFSERPPTAVGRRAFSDAVASVMHVRDLYKKILSNPGDERTEDQIISGGMEKNLSVITQVVDDFFTASGLTQDGEKISDKDVRKKGMAAYKKSSEVYAAIISASYRELGVRYIEEIRNKNGLKELMDAPDPGTGPVFGMVTEKDPQAAEKHKDVIERLKEANKAARLEAAQLMAGVDAIREKVTQEYFDEKADERRKFLLEGAFSMYSSSVDERICKLLYIQEATVACAAWVLLSLPVDPMLKQYIKDEWGAAPEYLNGDIKISEMQGFVFLKEHERRNALGDMTELEDFRETAEKLKNYLYTHPWQFDAQCLMSICRGTEELPAVVADTKYIRDRLDRLTQEGYADKLELKERIELYNIWVMADLICRVGYLMTEFLTAHEKATVNNAAEDLKKYLPFMSYSKQGRQCRETVKRLMRERTSTDV